MEEQVVWESTVRLPRGVEVLMKDISLWGKEWYPWISQRWDTIFKCSDNERNSSPQKWRFSHRYLFQIWMTFFLLRKCSESCSCCSFSIAIVYGDYISVKCQKGLNTAKYTCYISSLFVQRSWTCLHFVWWTDQNQNRFFTQNIWDSLLSNQIQCRLYVSDTECHWFSCFLQLNFIEIKQKVIFNLRALLDSKASSQKSFMQ